MKSKTKIALSVYLTLFVDNLAATIVFPLFAPLFLDPATPILSMEVRPDIRMILLGLFLAIFPLAQFLFAPLLGSIADQNRKRELLLQTLFIGVVGYLFSGYGIANHHLSVLMIGRFLSGISASNLAICFLSLVQISKDLKEKDRLFSYGSALIGATFVLGPLIGGKLSDSSLFSWFSLAFPMWVGAALTIINLLVVYFLFVEHKEERVTQRPFHVFAPLMRHLLAIYFLFLFAWNMLFQFMPALLVREFQDSVSSIGNALAGMGILWIFGSLAATLYIKFHKKLRPLLLFSIMVFWAALLSLLVVHSFPVLAFTVAIAVFFAGVIWPLFTSAIASHAKRGAPGRMLGVLLAVQSLAMLLAPLFGGFLIGSSFDPLFLAAGMLTLVGFIWTLKVKAI